MPLSRNCVAYNWSLTLDSFKLSDKHALSRVVLHDGVLFDVLPQILQEKMSIVRQHTNRNSNGDQLPLTST